MSQDDRTLPQNLEAERSVLGAILLHADCLADVTEHLEAAHFYRQAHQRIFSAVLALSGANVEVDFVTLKNHLTKEGELEEVGGPAYIAALTDGVPRSTNVGAYAQIVREKADLRSAIYAANATLAEAYEAGEDARAVLDRAEQRIFAIAQGETAAGFRQLSEILPEVMQQLEAWSQVKAGITGVPSGFLDLDHLTRGFQRSNLIIVAARPAMGKSSFVLNVAQYVAGLGKAVGFFSLEMSEEELAIRAMSGHARVDGHRLQRGYIRDAEWGRLSQAFGALSEIKLFIDESPFVTVFDMRSRARRLKAKHGLDLLVIDYTQLMIGQEKKENRNLEISAITRGLKALAKDLDVPVIALSQLSRDVERRENKRPMLADLRDSGALEQDADLVLFIYRDEVYRDDTADRGIAEIIIGKHRNGPIGTIKLAWLADQMRFDNLADSGYPADQQLPIGDRA